MARRKGCKHGRRRNGRCPKGRRYVPVHKRRTPTTMRRKRRGNWRRGLAKVHSAQRQCKGEPAYKTCLKAELAIPRYN